RSVFVTETTRNGRSFARFTGSGVIFDRIPTVPLRFTVGYLRGARIRGLRDLRFPVGLSWSSKKRVMLPCSQGVFAEIFALREVTLAGGGLYQI
ncbi:MAG: hypothetical protein ACKV2V_25410, partial [Blastocatellia bacterium]